MKLLKDMTEPELAEHLNRQLRFIKSQQTPDTLGTMLVIFGDDGITQYGATIDPETAPQALRELADRIEQRSTVKRERKMCQRCWGSGTFQPAGQEEIYRCPTCLGNGFVMS